MSSGHFDGSNPVASTFYARKLLINKRFPGFLFMLTFVPYFWRVTPAPDSVYTGRCIRVSALQDFYSSI